MKFPGVNPRLPRSIRGGPPLRASATQKLGYLGQFHPDICDELGVPPFCVYELDLEKLLEYAPRSNSHRALPRFPAVERDFAIVVDRDFLPNKSLVGLRTSR